MPVGLYMKFRPVSRFLLDCLIVRWRSCIIYIQFKMAASLYAVILIVFDNFKFTCVGWWLGGSSGVTLLQRYRVAGIGISVSARLRVRCHVCDEVIYKLRGWSILHNYCRRGN